MMTNQVEQTAMELWGDSNPDSLLSLCYDRLLDNFEDLSTFVEMGAFLIPNFADEILVRHQKLHGQYSQELLHLLQTSTTPLRLTSFNCARRLGDVITDFQYEQYPLVELDLTGVVREAVFDKIERLSSSPAARSVLEMRIDLVECNELEENFQLPNLRHLTLGVHPNEECPCYAVQWFFKNSPRLEHLTLTGTDLYFKHTDGVSMSRVLPMFPDRLTTLCLHDVDLGDLHRSLPLISRQSNLRRLDLSMAPTHNQPMLYTDPVGPMTSLITSLPRLEWLDVGGTNLLGSRDKDSYNGTSVVLGNRTFEFLGLLGCADDWHTASYIPAKLVAGLASEEQVLVCLEVYLNSWKMLQAALNELFTLYRHQQITNDCASYLAIMNAFEHWPNQSDVLMSCSAVLFHILRENHLKAHIPHKEITRVIRCLISAMKHDEITLLRNCILNLCHLTYPADVTRDFTELCAAVVSVLRRRHTIDSYSATGLDQHLIRLHLFVVNLLVCQAGHSYKRLAANAGIIQVVLDIIEEKVEATSTTLLETAWSCLWNITDETADNCEEFLQHDGIELFFKCSKKFSDNSELQRNVMGLMGNISEVQHLRDQLRTTELIAIFRKLVVNGSPDPTTDIEVSYSSVGVLAHLLLEDVWPDSQAELQLLLDDMETAISSWSLEAERHINYNSLRPILALLGRSRHWQCQLWAVWALTNLCLRDPAKHCNLILRDSGETVLTSLYRSDVTHPHVRHYCHVTLHSVRNHLISNQLTGDDVYELVKDLEAPPPSVSYKS